MSDLFANPVGLDGFEFIEWATPDGVQLEPLFEKMGFAKVAKHRSKQVELFRQGDINFLINNEPDSHAAFFAQEHGPCVCGMGFRVKDAHHAYAYVLKKGAEPVDIPTGPMELRLPAVKGIGGAPIYLIDRYSKDQTVYDIDFEYIDSIDKYPSGCGFKQIDHVTNNAYRGRMDYWVRFYEDVFGFRELRYFDIKGEYTGLVSRAMTSPDGNIRIPVNEESSKGAGQIEEFLREYNGEGIQHVAMTSDDLIKSWDLLKANDIPFMSPPPATYYDMLEDRLPDHGEPTKELQKRGILLDGSTVDGDPRLLLQIFSETQVGPVFFEFIQRKKDDGFGEGNFQALFESMERDQISRGVLEADGF